MKHILYSSIFLLILSAFPAYAEDCRKADKLVRQAYDSGDSPEQYPQQARLFEEALRLCPEHPQAHNNLGWIAEQQGRFDDAQRHYQQSVQANPESANARAGLGRMYEQQKQFPLALEAYLHACPQKPELSVRIKALLENNRYQVAAGNTILNKESLLLLFDRVRREELNRMLKQCRFRSGEDFGTRGVAVEAAVDFPNILFETGKAALQPGSLRQIEEIAFTLQELRRAQVIINGHTDKQPFAGVSSAEENLRLNLKLSEDRANAVSQEFTRRGISSARIKTHGYGPTQPAIDADTPAAYVRNRRVVVEVR